MGRVPPLPLGATPGPEGRDRWSRAREAAPHRTPGGAEAKQPPGTSRQCLFPPQPPPSAPTAIFSCHPHARVPGAERAPRASGREEWGWRARARAPPPLCPAAGSRPQPSRGFPLAASPPRPSSVRPGRGHGPEVSRARPLPFRVLCPSGRGLAAPPALAAVWPRAPASSKVTPRPHRLLPVVGPCERL